MLKTPSTKGKQVETKNISNKKNENVKVDKKLTSPRKVGGFRESLGGTLYETDD
jgi:hypothetical protein